MALGGTLTNDGCNLLLKLLYGDPAVSALATIQIGADPTTAVIGDSTMTPVDGSVAGTAVERVPPVSTLIDDCSDIAKWTHGGQAAADVANTTTYKEGYDTTDDTSLDLEKSGAAAVTWWYDFTFVGAEDMSNSWCYVWVHILDATALAKFSVANAIQVWLGTGGVLNYDYWNFALADLAVGWNLLCCEVENSDGVGGLGVTTNAVDNVRLYMQTVNAADLLATGDVIMDFWHYAVEADYNIAQAAGYPTYDTAARYSECRYLVPIANARGYLIQEAGEFNADATKILARRSVHTSISKSSKDDVIYIMKNRINPA
jgi:hypothetical protein